MKKKPYYYSSTVLLIRQMANLSLCLLSGRPGKLLEHCWPRPGCHLARQRARGGRLRRGERPQGGPGGQVSVAHLWLDKKSQRFRTVFFCALRIKLRASHLAHYTYRCTYVCSKLHFMSITFCALPLAHYVSYASRFVHCLLRFTFHAHHVLHITFYNKLHILRIFTCYNCTFSRTLLFFYSLRITYCALHTHTHYILGNTYHCALFGAHCALPIGHRITGLPPSLPPSPTGS